MYQRARADLERAYEQCARREHQHHEEKKAREDCHREELRRLDDEEEREVLRWRGRSILNARMPGAPRGYGTRSPSRSRASRSRPRTWTQRGCRQPCSRSRSREPIVPKPREIFTTFGPCTTPESIISSPFYTRIDITSLFPLAQLGAIFHAVHPVSRRYLRQLFRFGYETTQLCFVGEFLDEELYSMTQINELAEKMQETVHRVNELLKQKGEESVGCPREHREKIALREMMHKQG
jgi:hypothetical protein